MASPLSGRILVERVFDTWMALHVGRYSRPHGGPGQRVAPSPWFCARYRRNHTAVTRPQPVDSAFRRPPRAWTTDPKRYAETLAERSFTHLHTHTEFSMLDGAARVGDLVEAAVADGQTALGITDHGNMYGVLDFYAACRKAGINPIIGTEAYMAAESRHERPVRRGKVDDTGGDTGGGEKLYYHLTLLAESNEGYRNLLKLSSAAYLEGYYLSLIHI